MRNKKKDENKDRPCRHRGHANVVEEPLIPKLYPNGNYNKTWNDELLDNYIDGPW